MRLVTVWQISRGGFSRINLLLRMEKESSKEAMEMFKVLNYIMLSNRGDPITLAILEDDFSKFMVARYCTANMNLPLFLIFLQFGLNILGLEVKL